MSSMWGRNIKISIFGESHGKAIGVVIDNLPSGIALDLNEINHHMKRRAPGQHAWATPRKEDDEVEILSGFFNGYTTGTPLSMIVHSKDRKSSDYDQLRNLPRPGHADHTGHIRYAGFEDFRGSGHFSGRLTAAVVMAGSVARQILAQKGVNIAAHIKKIAGIEDEPIDTIHPQDILLNELKNKQFAVINDAIGAQMKEAIADARDDSDSVGGVIEAVAIGIKAGVGSPMFSGVESIVSSILFAVPAVKGVEFGAGFAISDMQGSTSNDEYTMTDNGISTITNNNGGIIGGITNAMPIIVRVAIKPTASIGKEQNTINMKTGTPQKLKIDGRHDPCIVPRAVPVIESALAIALLDCYMDKASRKG
ncbi:MAG: chorismate synthase [Clostridiales bacterium]|nr:chorismate synthase [Clostridiales bacterium]